MTTPALRPVDWWGALAGAAEDGQDVEVHRLARLCVEQSSPESLTRLLAALTLSQRDVAVLYLQHLTEHERHDGDESDGEEA